MQKTIRLTLDSLNNIRLATLTGLPGASGIVGIGVVGVMIVGNATQASAKDGRAVNCYTQTVSSPVSGERLVYLVKRPGSASTLTPQAGSIGNAIKIASGGALAGKIFSAFGATNSSLYDSATQLVTNNADTTVITGRATGITETEISTTPTLAISSSDSTGWYYQNAGTVTKIANANFPGNAGLTLAGTFAHLDGFPCIMTTTGRLYAGDVNSITAWSAASYGVTDAYPDGGIGCVRFKQTIMAFGRESIEFWRNAGNSPFPLARVQESTLKIGAIAADAICQISDNVFFVGSTPEGGLSVFSFAGSLQRISTPEIDAMLILAGASGITLSPMRFGGRSFILVLASNTTTYAYCIEEKTWNIWTTASYPLWWKTASASTGATIATYMVSNRSTAGKVFITNDANLVFTDNSDTYTALIQTPNVNLGTNKRKFWRRVDVIGDESVAASSITLSVSDDDYQSTRLLATLDMADSRPSATRLGSSRERSFMLSHSAAVALRLHTLEITAEIGSQ